MLLEQEKNFVLYYSSLNTSVTTLKLLGKRDTMIAHKTDVSSNEWYRTKLFSCCSSIQEPNFQELINVNIELIHFPNFETNKYTKL